VNDGIYAPECRILQVKFKNLLGVTLLDHHDRKGQPASLHSPCSMVPNDLVCAHHLNNPGYATDINYILHFALTILVCEKNTILALKVLEKSLLFFLTTCKNHVACINSNIVVTTHQIAIAIFAF
jgi:hypothetical protein